MGHKHQWTRHDAERLGLVVLEALANARLGHYGEVDLNLEDRWVRIQTDHLREMVVIFEMETPPEFAGNREEG